MNTHLIEYRGIKGNAVTIQPEWATIGPVIRGRMVPMKPVPEMEARRMLAHLRKRQQNNPGGVVWEYRVVEVGHGT